MFQPPDFWFIEDAKIFLGGGVGSFGGGTEGLDLLIPVGAADNFVDQSGVVLDRHMSGVAVVVDPVFAVH